MSYGQEQRIKQIEKDLKEHTQQDTFRVNRLTELPVLITLPIGKLDTMATEALSISRKLHYSEGEVEALSLAVRIAYRKNNLPQALALAQQAIAMAEKIKDKTYLSDAYAAIAAIENYIGESKQALAYQLKAEAAAQTTQNKSLIAQRQLGVSTICSASFGDYSKAMEWALKSEKNAEDVNNLTLLAKGMVKHCRSLYPISATRQMRSLIIKKH